MTEKHSSQPPPHLHRHRRPVALPPITGKEATADLLHQAFPAFAGRNVREAFRLMQKSVDEGFTVFLTLSGAMTPAGLHHSCIIPLIENGLVHALTTTGANLYHDIHRSIGYQVHEIDPHGSDLAYRQEDTVRIYDLAISNDILLGTDMLIGQLLRSPAFQKPMTTAELHHELGRLLAEHEERLQVPAPSLLATCFRHDVPIFCGAPQDGSLFLESVLLAIVDDGFKFRLEPERDVMQMAALQLLTQREGQTAVWIIGGGVPKNFTLQGEPTLSQIFGLEARGFDLDLQICVDVADNGALSSCNAGEAHTWGKTSAECVQTSSVYLRSDVSIALPMLTHALLGWLKKPLAPRRLMKRLAAAESSMREEVRRRHGAGGV